MFLRTHEDKMIFLDFSRSGRQIEGKQNMILIAGTQSGVSEQNRYSATRLMRKELSFATKLDLWPKDTLN